MQFVMRSDRLRIFVINYMLELCDISRGDNLLYGMIAFILFFIYSGFLIQGVVIPRGRSVVTLRQSHRSASSWPTHSLSCLVKNVIDFIGIHLIDDFLRFLGSRSSSRTLLPYFLHIRLDKWKHHSVMDQWCLAFGRCLNFFESSLQPISILFFIFLSAIAQSKEIWDLGNVSDFQAFGIRVALVIRDLWNFSSFCFLSLEAFKLSSFF